MTKYYRPNSGIVGILIQYGSCKETNSSLVRKFIFYELSVCTRINIYHIFFVIESMFLKARVSHGYRSEDCVEH